MNMTNFLSLMIILKKSMNMFLVSMLMVVIMTLIPGISARADEFNLYDDFISNYDGNIVPYTGDLSEFGYNYSLMRDSYDVFSFDDGNTFIFPRLNLSIPDGDYSGPDTQEIISYSGSDSEISPRGYAWTPITPDAGFSLSALPTWANSINVEHGFDSSALGLVYKESVDTTSAIQFFYDVESGLMDIEFPTRYVAIMPRSNKFPLFDKYLISVNLKNDFTVTKHQYKTANFDFSLQSSYYEISVNGQQSKFLATNGVPFELVLDGPLSYTNITITPHLIYNYKVAAVFQQSGFVSTPPVIGKFVSSCRSSVTFVNLYGFNYDTNNNGFTGQLFGSLADILMQLQLNDQRMERYTNNIITAINNFSNRNYNAIVDHKNATVAAVNQVNSTLVSQFTTWISSHWGPFVNVFNAFASTNHTDLANILHVLQKADGANGPLDDANDDFKNEMAEFDKVTDTSGQYDKIDPSMFDFDATIFTSIAGTATFFGDMLTAAFSAFGQFAIPLRLFLVCTLVSVVIGIVTNRTD